MPVIPLPVVNPLPPGAEGWCGWDVEPADLCPDWDTYTEAQQETALSIATLVMWSATGRRYGPCEITVRPCQDQGYGETYRVFPAWWGGDSGWSGSLPYLWGGVWYNGCGCGDRCCCAPRCEVILDGPVSSITEVLVRGDVVPDDEYRVDVAGGSYRLVKLTDGCWPTCQDFDQGQDGADAFAVTYTRGAQVPTSLLRATGLLACELGKAIVGAPCALPQRLSSLTRQGVTAEFVATELDVSTFQTGINEVDMVIRALNPSQRTRPPVVISPDSFTSRDRMTVIGPA
jgi:hypothetical protein